ncbi:acetyl-CoA carboxylase, carboxyltransferase subunit beta [Haploplasma axanthum]|uniref:Acetyl-coenzyme A carboxylase carboxyl transferase subunit beta n=1 Tax=Haploplasma axanthum TaxID=29552 RepID=A0A449BEY2_HAPAX|nr:acetyl-CoA carboxylase, carboxyltransferase subunit beta [Haploplasma axanthum]VEU80982.1 Acetyl-coenzyme A carboxylase carboxyl transferase subunit beta [Haploplasma axanthum]
MKQLLNERKKRLIEFRKIVRKKEYEFKPINIPEHIFSQCEQCLSALYTKDLEESMYVCPYCGHHFRIGAQKRLEVTVDKNTFKPMFDDLESVNFLNIPGYDNKLKAGKELTGNNEAFLCGEANINNERVAIGVLDSNFIMGSMGSVVGEKITRLIEFAGSEEIPLVIFSASGGARMQEGIISLMQMAKTSAALSYFKGLYISIMTNPTTGGVAASFAALGDINIAETTSLIGFAGARVIKQTIQQDLPQGFQTEKFQMEKGQIDLIVQRKDMKNTISRLISFHKVK